MAIQAPKVPCRICALDGVDNLVTPAGMSGHIGCNAHRKAGWTKATYIDRFGPNSAADFGDRMPTATEVAEATRRIQEFNHSRSLELGLSDESLLYLANPVLEELDDEEKRFYEQNFALFFQAVDRDEVQIPSIASLVTDLTSLRRLRKAQLKQSKSKDTTKMNDLEEVIEKTEKRVQASMKALHLSRESLVKNKDSLKSLTAAGLISGYCDEVERNTIETLDTLMLEVKKALAKSAHRVEGMILQYARDLEPEEKEDADSDSTGGIFSFEDAVKRAEIPLETMASRPDDGADTP